MVWVSAQGFAPRVNRVITGTKSARTIRHVSYVPAILVLLGIIIPSQVQLSVAETKFTFGRLAVILLLVPALLKLLQGGRRIISSDFFAFATATWMMGASLLYGRIKYHILSGG